MKLIYYMAQFIFFLVNNDDYIIYTKRNRIMKEINSDDIEKRDIMIITRHAYVYKNLIHTFKV
jgi:hypothetical protein